MMAGGALFVLVLLGGLAGSLLVYYLIRSEHDNRETMDRRQAERAARRDTRERE